MPSKLVDDFPLPNLNTDPNQDLRRLVVLTILVGYIFNVSNIKLIVGVDPARWAEAWRLCINQICTSNIVVLENAPIRCNKCMWRFTNLYVALADHKIIKDQTAQFTAPTE